MGCLFLFAFFYGFCQLYFEFQKRKKNENIFWYLTKKKFFFNICSFYYCDRLKYWGKWNIAKSMKNLIFMWWRTITLRGLLLSLSGEYDISRINKKNNENCRLFRRGLFFVMCILWCLTSFLCWDRRYRSTPKGGRARWECGSRWGCTFCIIQHLFIATHLSG